MHLDYLGDALDHWKGSIFADLQTNHLIRFAADPMPTDAPDWTPFHRQLYARLLHIQQSQIVLHVHDLSQRRAEYFAEIDHDGDLFLDPDNGIQTSRPNDRAKYITPNEIHERLAKHSDHILAVYQHIRATRTRDRLNQIVDVLSSVDPRFTCCSYESGTVAMLFLSRNVARIDSIFNHFKTSLGDRAQRRIHRWQPNNAA